MPLPFDPQAMMDRVIASLALFLLGFLELAVQACLAIAVGTYFLKRWPAPTLLLVVSFMIARRSVA